MILLPSLSNSQKATDSSAGPEIQGQVVARIPFKISSGLIMIPVKINGSRDLNMYLDTGMSAAVVVLFHKELIQEIGLKNTQNVLLGGAGGEGQKPGTLAPGAIVQVAGLEMKNQRVIVLDDDRGSSRWHLDGVIGKTLFDDYVAHIDYEKCVMILYDPADVTVDGSLVPIPIRLDIGVPIIESRVNIDGADEIPVRLVVDLGHRNALFLMVDEIKRIQAPPLVLKSMAGRGLQGEISAKLGRIREIKLGPYSLKDIPTSFLDPGSNMGLSRDIVDGDLGSLILNRFHVIIDYRHKRMFLIPNRYWPKPYEVDMAGLVLEQDRDGFYRINYVIGNSPAAEHDLRKGDNVTRLNGKDVREYTFGEVFDLLRQEGRDVDISIARGDGNFEVTIRLRRLI